jgi:hypothetical protein
LCRNCLQQRVIEGETERRIEVRVRRGRRCRKLLVDLKERKGKERILLSEGEISVSQYVEISLWKRSWTCRETDY